MTKDFPRSPEPPEGCDRALEASWQAFIHVWQRSPAPAALRARILAALEAAAEAEERGKDGER